MLCRDLVFKLRDGAETSIEVDVESACAPVQGVLRLLAVLLVVAPCKMAAACKTKLIGDGANPLQAHTLTFSWIKQELTYTIHPDRPVQLQGSAFEMFLGSLKQRCS